jgi:hypothetical protein
MRDVKAWPNDPSDLVNLESGGVEKVTTGIKLFFGNFSFSDVDKISVKRMLSGGYDDKITKPITRYQKVNQLTLDDLVKIINYMKSTMIRKWGSNENSVPYLERVKRYIAVGPPDRWHKTKYWKCNLSPPMNKNGKVKYVQFAPSIAGVKTIGPGVKVCVHHIWWRYIHRGYLIPSESEGLSISHRDADIRVLNLVLETRDENESRKYCHKYNWYVRREGEDRARCPHWERPCTGPDSKKSDLNKQHS